MNEIEKKIQEAGQLHAISKSSDQILEAYETKHAKRRQKKFFFIPAITTLLASATAVAVIFGLSPKPIHLQAETKGFNDGSSVLTSVVGNLSLHYYSQEVTAEQNRLYSSIPQDEFNQIVMDIDSAYNPYAYYRAHSAGIYYTFDSTSFRFDDRNYRYELSVNNTLVYLKDNLSEIKTKGVYEGLIRLGDHCYPCEITATVSKNVVSTTFDYRVGSALHSLYTKTANQVTTITHQTKINDDISEIKSVKLLSDANTFTASFIDDDKLAEVNKERSFSYTKGNDFVGVSYKKNENVYSGIKLRLSNNRARQHIYSLEGLEDVIL